MFWSCNPLDLTVAWETNNRLFRQKQNTQLSWSSCYSHHLSCIFLWITTYFKGDLFSPPLCFNSKNEDDAWNSNKKKITARATSLYKRYSDLWRQIGFWSVFLFEDILCILHPALQRGVDISDDKLITPQPFHLPLVPMCLCNVYENFHLYISQGPCCAAYSNQPITFFPLLQNPNGRFGDVVGFFFSQSLLVEPACAWSEDDTEEDADLHFSRRILIFFF